MEIQVEFFVKESTQAAGIRIWRLSNEGEVIVLIRHEDNFVWDIIPMGEEPPFTYQFPWFMIKSKEIMQSFVEQIVEALGLKFDFAGRDALVEAKNAHIKSLEHMLLGSEYTRIERGPAVDVRPTEEYVTEEEGL